MMNQPIKPVHIPILFFLWFPVASLLFDFAMRMLNEPLYRRVWESESGPTENITVIVLAFAVIYGLLKLPRWRQLPHWSLQVGLVLLTLACLYFAGEEASWGQHWFGWQTPEAVGALNDQNETNLHNMSSWLDQKPRLLLELWVMFAGLLIPALTLAGRPITWSFPHPFWYGCYWPLVPAALLAFLIRLPERFQDWFGWQTPPPFDIRVSENQELMFAVFMTCFLIIGWQQAGQQEKRPL